MFWNCMGLKFRDRDQNMKHMTEQRTIKQSFKLSSNQKSKPCKCGHQLSDHRHSVNSICEWYFCKCELYEELK